MSSSKICGIVRYPRIDPARRSLRQLVHGLEVFDRMAVNAGLLLQVFLLDAEAPAVALHMRLDVGIVPEFPVGVFFLGVTGKASGRNGRRVSFTVKSIAGCAVDCLS